MEAWTVFNGYFAYSPQHDLYIANDIAGIPFAIIRIDGLSFSRFDDCETIFIKVDDVIDWHLKESHSDSGDRLWHGTSATEFSALRSRFDNGLPGRVVPKTFFSDEFFRQAYYKAERDGDKSGIRLMRKNRPDLFREYLPSNPVESNKKPESGFEKDEDKKDVYFIQGCETQRIKIGISNNVGSRLKGIQSSEPLKLLAVIKQGGKDLERRLHEKFEGLRVHGEWFRPDPQLLEYIGELTP